MTFRASVEKYLKAVAAQVRQGDAREESYYDALKALFVELGPQDSNAHTTLTVLPRETEAGNPDMRVWSGDQHVIGYVECKELNQTNLDHVEVSEQLKRYLKAFPNVILTNFLEFRLYRSGESFGEPVTIASHEVLTLGKQPPFQHEDQFNELLERFFGFELPRTYTSQTLAVALADRTRYLQQQVLAELIDDEDHQRSSELVNLMAEFKQVLMSDLTSDTFADLYAQTITYGLFAARMRVTGTFTRETALGGIPATIGILRKLFRYISGGDTPERMRVIIDDIAGVLAVADTDAVFKGYGKNGRDPVADFYETFLGKYDPAKKKQHGVYYTPQPVVSYIVRSVDQILRDSFGKPDGLADPSVTVLDPAAGTMTFPATAVRLAAETFKAKYGDGSLDSWIKGHVLRDFYAFELMMAPYAIGHLRMGTVLTELGYTMSANDRFKLYLTNTLEDSVVQPGQFGAMSGLADESAAAGRVKREERILVIMGNPPYSVGSSNNGDWVKALLQDYKTVDGHPLRERKQTLNDDYVKFIRMAQWKIDQAGEGIVAFITNNGYLDNPTFRGMRQSLMTSFNQLHVLNVHGSSLKQEKCPDGSRDENVFDIMQGVAILVAVKRKGLQKGVWQADLWGTRDSKYHKLAGIRFGEMTWRALTPSTPDYLLVPRDDTLIGEYLSYPSLADIMLVHSVGMRSHRDSLCIQYSADQLWSTITRFVELEPEDARAAFQLGGDTADWSVRSAQQDILSDGPDQGCVRSVAYRPFDTRFTYYTGRSGGFLARPMRGVMQHMFKQNLALLTCKECISDTWQHAIVVGALSDDSTVSNKTRERSYSFPAYLYPASNSGLFELADGERTSNMSPDFLASLTRKYNHSVKPDDVFAYIYAILYAPFYRTRYAEFLKSDFPRIPFTKDRDTFVRLADLGRQLIDLHLMRSLALDNPISRFCGRGDSAVTKVEYDADLERVSINPTQYFDGIAPDLWAYQIGGYQVLAKWLKDRKGRFLTSADTQHYSRVVSVLAETSVVQREIDDCAPFLTNVN
jgi:type I restriction-modification system DNA methylase subunit